MAPRRPNLEQVQIGVAVSQLGCLLGFFFCQPQKAYLYYDGECGDMNGLMSILSCHTYI